MKRIGMILSFILITISAFAQYQAGNILVNSTLVFTGEKSEVTVGNTTVNGPKTTTFEIAPGLEYFVTDKISVGAEIGFSSIKEVDEDPAGAVDKTTDMTTLTTISPFASMYFINEERFGLFCKLGIGFGFGKNTYEEETGNVSVKTESKISSLDIGLRPGVAVHLSERFGMTATFGWLGYSSYKFKNDDSDYEAKNTSYGLEFRPSVGFGLYFKLK